MAVSAFTIVTPEQAQWFEADVRPSRGVGSPREPAFSAIQSEDDTSGLRSLYDPDPESWPHLDWRWRDRSPRDSALPGAVSIDRSSFVPKRIDDV